jgi:hypothetical protein
LCKTAVDTVFDLIMQVKLVGHKRQLTIYTFTPPGTILAHSYDLDRKGRRAYKSNNPFSNVLKLLSALKFNVKYFLDPIYDFLSLIFYRKIVHI